MKKETQKKLITAAILVAVGLIAAGLIADYRFQSSDPQNTVFREYYDSVGWENAPTGAQRVMMGISDGLMAAGVCYAGVGLMVWISTTGFFDMISYGFSSLWVMFTPFKNPKNHPRFYDYKQAKMEKRKKSRTPVLYVGLAFLAAAALFAGLYYLV